MTNTTTATTAIELAIANTNGTAQSIEAFVMQDSITVSMIEEGLNELFTSYDQSVSKAIKANLFGRSLEMDWDDYVTDAINCEVCGRSIDEDVHDACISTTPFDMEGTTVAPALVETTDAATSTITNTNTKGENNTMTTTNTIVSNTTTNTKGAINMTNKSITFSASNLNVIQNASGQIAKVLFGMGVTAPLFSQFIGTDAKGLSVDVRRNKFIVTKEAGEESIQFSSANGKQIIDYLMVVMPGLFPKFMESAEFKALDKLNLKGRLTAKAKARGKKTRETVLMASLNLSDIYVAEDGSVLGKLRDFSLEELLDNVMKEIDTETGKNVELRKGVEFFIAKDTNINNLNSIHSLYQKMSGSLAADRFATKLNKKVETINVTKEYSKDGMVLKIEEPVKAIVLDEMCTFDGSGSLPFGNDINSAVLKAVFSKVNVINKENGELVAGEDISDSETFSYKTYTKSMSQARSNGAVGFRSVEDVISFFIGTGQDEVSYGKEHKVDGKATGFNKMDVAKSYKRFMLAGSNGLKADKGLLSTFGHKPEVKYFAPGEKNVVGEIKPAYIEISNRKGETFTIALLNEFYAEIPAGQDFLLNVLSESNAFVGVEKFKQWSSEKARKALLFRNLTDGQGWHSSRVTTSLREAGIINSFDAFQLRISNAVKGASFEFNPICELFGADLILTEGMVKSEEIVTDIRENGFQLFIVGQRKDGNDGVWIASQATQQMGMTTDELKQGVTNSVDFVKNSIENQITSDILTMLNASEEEDASEFDSFDYVRLAEEFGDVLDEQYIKDQIVGLGVKKLNKLLDSKVFTTEARTRYMFSDVFAIYNAAKDGRYTVVQEDAVLGAYEVVAPSKKDGEYFLEEGYAVSVRFPVTVTHEIPVVKAVMAPEYMEFVKNGLWQGVTFFDAFSWVVAQQAGADHDGDTSIIIFNEIMVNARMRKEAELYGRTEMLPFVDAYVKYVDGEAVKFDSGCPSYVTEAAKKKLVTPEVEDMNGFDVQGNTIYFVPEDAAARRNDFLEVMAGLSANITVDTIESSLIGLIANRAMVLTDLLSRSTLNNDQRAAIESDLLILTTAGRWEIDRPKHGGAYLEMPLVKALFANFDSRFFEEGEMELTDEAKRALLVQEKGVYAFIFGEVRREGKLVGFEVKKPQWLASQKDEYGVVNADSTYEEVFTFAEQAIEALCVEFKQGHNNSAKNQIRTRITYNMEAGSEIESIKQTVFGIYSAYTQKEAVRAAGEKDFMMTAETELKKEGVFRKKNMNSLTKAKKTAKIRAQYDNEIVQFKNARDLYKAEFRKEMYTAAKAMNLDIRTLVGALYLIANEAKNNGKVDFRKDGREYRFVASSGFISLPFEVFAEEMNSLISGRVSETYFVPQDITFTLLQSSLVQAAPTASNQVKVRVLNPIAKVANKVVEVNRTVRVAIKPEQQKDGVRLVAYFLNRDTKVTDYMEVTNEDAAYKGFAPTNLSMAGIYEIPVTKIAFGDAGAVATVRFQ